ncbi:phosphatase 2C-like domain-containing protein [Apiosordaria backusii]|uniref:Phosphatase 2C-like domain-containing protein n=1 Tax=Apiosordaria backusii TaxID=314023 RepID=A0AA40K179_9PEZI|nr:phosphatase 2C-like domain-containing protein [Apiosordaria backusii]
MPPLPCRRALGQLSVRSVRTASTRLPPPPTLLDAFMSYVATFFHNTGRVQMRNFTISTPRTLRLAGASRHLRVPTRATILAHRDATQPCDSWRAQSTVAANPILRRGFHNYFVTHLPSSSLHPDSRTSAGPGHKLPRSASTPHTPEPGSSPALDPPNMPSRDLTVVRIPLRSAKHHFGTCVSRGQRPYNEDTNQAGTITLPAFSKRVPVSVVRSQTRPTGESINAYSALGDPQIFYFGVFDGHGGSECSEFLRDELHGYIEEAAAELELESSLKGDKDRRSSLSDPDVSRNLEETKADNERENTELSPNPSKAVELEQELLNEYKRTVGGYFRRFHPAHFTASTVASTSSFSDHPMPPTTPSTVPATLESVLAYAFLRADLDFITAQARKPDPEDKFVEDMPLNKDEVLGVPHLPPSGHGIGGTERFKGGSTASVALISTPTPAPFWHPNAHSTLVVAHVGDTRVLLCETKSGKPLALTSDHRPSSPVETRRMSRYANSMITDSFGEERIQGLANSRSFGDMQSKRIGVSAEPEITRVEMGPAEFSFLVLMSDGVSGSLSDQEIVDVIKESKTPEEGARRVVEYATEVSNDGDNATCLVIRLGGWERRSEGGVGSLGTKEMRDMRRDEALDPRRRRS